MWSPLLVCALGFVAAPSAGGRMHELFRPLSCGAALATAERERRVVLVEFCVRPCEACELLDATVWSDASVLAWADENVVAIRVDVEAEMELADRFAIDVRPTIVFVRPDASELGRTYGYPAARAFLAEVNDLLAGRNALASAREARLAHENDPQARQRHGNALARAGQHPEALAEYLWCFDHGNAHDPHYFAVRVSFLLGHLADLARRYPPARAALVERRDAAAARALANVDDDGALYDALAIDGELREDVHVAQLYDALTKDGPLTEAQRVPFRRNGGPALVRARRYAAFLDVVGDADAWLERELTREERIDVTASLAAVRPADRSDAEHAQLVATLRERQRGRSVEAAARLYEALLGTQSGEQAARVAERTLAFERGTDTYRELVAAAVRANARTAAFRLVERAVAAVPEHARPFVERELVRVLEQAVAPGADAR